MGLQYVAALSGDSLAAPHNARLQEIKQNMFSLTSQNDRPAGKCAQRGAPWSMQAIAQSACWTAAAHSVPIKHRARARDISLPKQADALLNKTRTSPNSQVEKGRPQGGRCFEKLPHEPCLGSEVGVAHSCAALAAQGGQSAQTCQHCGHASCSLPSLRAAPEARPAVATRPVTQQGPG